MDPIDSQDRSKEIIARYQQDEQTMIRLFIDWCRQYDIDPVQIYTVAYPTQPQNDLLQALMVEAEQASPLDVPTATLLDALQLFGNEELAFVIAALDTKIQQ